MKKLIYTALFLAVLFMVTACGDSKDKEERNTDKESEISTVSSKQPDEEPEKLKAAKTETQPAESARESTQQEETGMKMKVQVGDTVFTATLAENSSVDALKELMADGSVTLPQNNEQMNTQAGDIILYQSRTFVIYYDTNSWSLTPIGKIDNVDAEELREALGTGDVTVTLSLE